MALIERALNSPQECEFVDVFGIVSDEELLECVDGEVEDVFMERVTEGAGAFAGALEPRQETVGRRVAVRLAEDLNAFRCGHPPVVLGDAAAEELGRGLGRADPSGNPLEPVKLEFLGRADPLLMPEAVVVPLPAGAVEEEVGRAVLRLARMLQTLAVEWGFVEEHAGELVGGPDESFMALPVPDPGTVDGAPSWEWLVEDEEDRPATVVHPAAVAALRCACAHRRRAAAGFHRSRVPA